MALSDSFQLMSLKYCIFCLSFIVVILDLFLGKIHKQQYHKTQKEAIDNLCAQKQNANIIIKYNNRIFIAFNRIKKFDASDAHFDKLYSNEDKVKKPNHMILELCTQVAFLSI